MRILYDNVEDDDDDGDDDDYYDDDDDEEEEAEEDDNVADDDVEDDTVEDAEGEDDDVEEDENEDDDAEDEVEDDKVEEDDDKDGNVAEDEEDDEVAEDGWRIMMLKKMRPRGRKTMMFSRMMLRKRTDPKIATRTLCEPAQSKCTWTFHKSHFMQNGQVIFNAADQDRGAHFVRACAVDMQLNF